MTYFLLLYSLFMIFILQRRRKIMSPAGLGLSFSYDIVKAHGGVPIGIGMKVETKEGEGSKFIIQLPG